ncbi:hypothetical protein Hbl1158_15400 (plasmid) [Halobaculum sp. CBA1158]|uniref:HalOD1 output domain-containing protein n=1 Tax=Halobaculum sp. CBA1158 TaxID=2904243 RepID=UPI001F2AA200|nr:HalOD1 output domain-containing protein [Halobaculum sp. CBA1158]UIP01520.1 hypothetical protein Hbl1158_15400 [Halobaculum sp. CBA1158]
MTRDTTLTSGSGAGLVHRTDWTDFESPSTAVVVAVADATGRDQTELDVLNESVDGDALDALVTESASSVDVTFEYAGVDVRVSSDGWLELEVER